MTIQWKQIICLQVLIWTELFRERSPRKSNILWMLPKNKGHIQSRRHGGALVGLVTPNKATSPQSETWNTKLVDCFSNLNVKPPWTNVKPPVDNFLATVMGICYIHMLRLGCYCLPPLSKFLATCLVTAKNNIDWKSVLLYCPAIFL